MPTLLLWVPSCASTTARCASKACSKREGPALLQNSLNTSVSCHDITNDITVSVGRRHFSPTLHCFETLWPRLFAWRKSGQTGGSDLGASS